MFKDEILENENRRKIYDVDRGKSRHPSKGTATSSNIPHYQRWSPPSYLGPKEDYLFRNRSSLQGYYAKPLEKEDKKVIAALRQKKLRRNCPLDLS